MTSQPDWPVVPGRIDDTGDRRLFFTQHEWDTIEAATARIYPTDHLPGAREAGVVRFIDRYLSGLGYVFASADGTGFLAIEGRAAEAWQARIGTLRRKYREGVQSLDTLARDWFGAAFSDLGWNEQDRTLEHLSGGPKPTDVAVSEAGETHVQNVSDDGLSFFEVLSLHTRQGMFADPVYGGNRDCIGWTLLGFPGPPNLASTTDGSYGHTDHFFEDSAWSDLIPHLREKA